MSEVDADKMSRFLNLVAHANWRCPPAVWDDQFRTALSDGLVTVGFGGVLKLTDLARQKEQRK